MNSDYSSLHTYTHVTDYNRSVPISEYIKILKSRIPECFESSCENAHQGFSQLVEGEAIYIMRIYRSSASPKPRDNVSVIFLTNYGRLLIYQWKVGVESSFHYRELNFWIQPDDLKLINKLILSMDSIFVFPDSIIKAIEWLKDKA